MSIMEDLADGIDHFLVGTGWSSSTWWCECGKNEYRRADIYNKKFDKVVIEIYGNTLFGHYTPAHDVSDHFECLLCDPECFNKFKIILEKWDAHEC